MNQSTDLHDAELEDRLRSLFHERALTVGDQPPGLPDVDRRAATVPLRAASAGTGGRRWAAVGIAAALLTAGAAGIALTRPDDTDAVTTAATAPDAPVQATAADTRVLVVNGSMFEGQGVLDMVRDELTARGFVDIATETDTDLATSAVYHRPGFEDVAAEAAGTASLMNHQVPFTPELDALAADVVVHLGADWNPMTSGEVRGDPSTLPYVAATPSESLQLGGPWPGPGNETDPAETPTMAVRSFLTRTVGAAAVATATVDEVFTHQGDGQLSGEVVVTFPGREPFPVGVSRPDGEVAWRVSRSADEGFGSYGPLPLGEAREPSIELLVDHPDGAVSARLWHSDGEGPTYVAELDRAVLDAGRPTEGSGRSRVLLKGAFDSGSAFVIAYFDEGGAPIRVWMTTL